MSVGDTFDPEAGIFEIEKECGFEAGDVEVAKHLSEVTVIETGDDLGIHNDSVFNNEVGNECADELAVVMDGKLLLRIAAETLFGQFDDEGAFVEFFIEAWLEREEHLVGCSDDFFGEFVCFHEII